MEEFGLNNQKQIYKFKIKKHIFPKIKTHEKNAGFKGNFKYKEAVCFRGYL